MQRRVAVELVGDLFLTKKDLSTPDIIAVCQKARKVQKMFSGIEKRQERLHKMQCL